MAISCISPLSHEHMSRSIPFKLELGGSEDGATQSASPSIPIVWVMTANEDWKGKNDPAERRRIQNRLNQRAYRQRQRAGESPKPYKPRSVSQRSTPGQGSEDEEESLRSEGSPVPLNDLIAGQQIPTTVSEDPPDGLLNQQTGQVWDELAVLINRNFMLAAQSNAQHIGVDMAALRSGRALQLPKNASQACPPALAPVKLQYEVTHDPIIDAIPHPRLRSNILRAAMNHQLDIAALAKSLRSSGAFELCNGTWKRTGVTVWSASEVLSSWELSESFVWRWLILLEGCDDLIAATNAWRGQRGERPLLV